MITSLLHPRRLAVCFATLTSAATLATLPSAHAAVNGIAPSAVVSGDTFTFEMIGYNKAQPSGDFYAIQTNLSATFGQTNTYTNDTLVSGQTLTVTSGETKSGSTFTDTITISVPNTFIPTGTTDSNGNAVDSLEFSIGNFNVPTGGTFDTLDYTTAISISSVTGTLGYTLNGTAGSLGLTNTTALSNGNRAFSSEESGSSPNGGSIAQYNPSSFTYTITYQAVPEPSTAGAMLFGAAGLVGLLAVRRRSARA